MIRSVVVLLFSMFLSLSLLAQDKKKVARPDLPGSFLVELGVNRAVHPPDDWSQEFWGSRTVNFYYQYPLRFGHSKFSFVPGIGLSLERFKLHNKFTLNKDKDPDGTYPLVAASTLFIGPNKSMIINNYFEMPIGFRFDTNPDDISRSFSVALGGRVGLLYDGFTKVRYRQDGEQKINKDKQFHGSNPYRFGLYGRIGVGGFNFFTYYNLSPMFETNKGPQSTKMNTWTIGISINGL